MEEVRIIVDVTVDLFHKLPVGLRERTERSSAHSCKTASLNKPALGFYTALLIWAVRVIGIKLYSALPCKILKASIEYRFHPKAVFCDC